MPDLDLRALIRDRQANGNRGTVRCLVCLDPDLIPEHDQIIQAAAADQRMATKFASRRRELERQIAERTVTLAFKVPTREQKAEYDRISDDEDSTEDLDFKIVSECFWRFEENGQPGGGVQHTAPTAHPDLDESDWLKLLEVIPPGEVNQMASVIYDRSKVAPDFLKLQELSAQVRK